MEEAVEEGYRDEGTGEEVVKEEWGGSREKRRWRRK